MDDVKNVTTEVTRISHSGASWLRRAPQILKPTYRKTRHLTNGQNNVQSQAYMVFNLTIYFLLPKKKGIRWPRSVAEFVN